MLVEEELDEAPLNDLAWDLVHQVLSRLDELRIDAVAGFGPGVLLDFGVDAPGSLAAGLALVEICMAGLCEVSLTAGQLCGLGWPMLCVQTDNPVEACLLSQYAGWKIKTDEYFAIGSGPMRAAAAKEPLFERLQYKEICDGVVGILESSQLPGPDIVEMIAADCGVSPDHVALLVAPTASLAGTMQVVARSVETALHKLSELGFDITRVDSAQGSAPVPPVAADDLTGIGRTNDAILYGARVTLWVTGDDESIRELGPRLPSSGSSQHGRPFLEIFEEAGQDFYKIDPLLFSPAQVVFHNVESGRVHHFGQVNEDILKLSFGL
ncbi:methenyltetrahydromethanopterin cyclohydrolase [Planctomicrobium piriforme]|uniref:Methenyltetrahydromethanopterin cyclohydrolase n=1 Tax=Planctomicrobium piriforme TaxID=1576369 RepID=A0A1I3AQU3_9PLAN|nr:methenyltetrahydromethanopterin cyclohydrolase [Planctomicrobium piriforme]SFH52350.1 methenyltetrahydromethanopterin cyclohydrolase [Planctomicrobium piriforme]